MKRFRITGLFLLCVSAFVYGAYVYWDKYTNDDFIRMEISGECVIVKLPEADRDAVKKYLSYRRLDVSPAFPVALGGYSSGREYSPNGSLYDENGPFRMRMGLTPPSIRHTIKDERKRTHYARQSCIGQVLPNGLAAMDSELGNDCPRTFKATSYIPISPDYDDFPTRVRCKHDKKNTLRL